MLPKLQIDHFLEELQPDDMNYKNVNIRQEEDQKVALNLRNTSQKSHFFMEFNMIPQATDESLSSSQSKKTSNF